MARIRTIKPEFFTSEDIVSLSPLARILYIAMWCEADKEGRMAWKPRTFKMRYLPGDSVDIDALCAEILSAKLVILYGEGLAYIPKFRTHQHINPRESESQLPDPDASSTRRPRVVHASVTVKTPDSDAQVGREGKGKEGDSTEPGQSDSAPAITIPLVDKTEHPVTAQQVAEWESAYPAVDVMQQLREMRTWSLANPARRKTARGVNAFVISWLGKEQDKGGGRRLPMQAAAQEHGVYV